MRINFPRLVKVKFTVADFFEVTAGNILGAIVTLFGIATFAWRIAVWQNKRIAADATAKETVWKTFAENQAKVVKEQFENSMELLRGEISELSIKATKQLRRQNRRSDFTNSNVRKVRNDTLDLQSDIYLIKRALTEKQIMTDENGVDAVFKREMARKKAEIERDDQEQMPKDDDDE